MRSTTLSGATRLGLALVLLLSLGLLVLNAPSSEARDVRHCSDFKNQQAAQLYYLSWGGPKRLIAHLDGDHDGLVCEGRPAPRYTRRELPSVYRHLAAPRVRGDISLNSVGSRYVNKAIQIKGYVSGAPVGRHKVVLQRKAVGSTRWVTRDTKRVRNGVYTFPNQRSAKAGIVRFRTRLWVGGRLADTAAIAVRVLRVPQTCASNPSPTNCPKPPPDIETRTIDTGPPDCTLRSVPTADQNRSRPYVWSTAAKAWVPGEFTDWVTIATGSRTATDTECPGGGGPGPDALLPDMGIRSITTCSPAEQQQTGTCFKVKYPTDGPLTGEKFLQFPVTTLNAGAGAAELNAHRSTSVSDDWVANQTIYNAGGSVSVVPAFTSGFYFAGDGHHHWHVRDFDDYSLMNAAGTEIATSEKHGYCLEDNTTYGPMSGQPGVPATEVYEHARMCGLNLPDTTSIQHGVSRGWGDTYPSTLPDQGIVITGLPDGVYTVVVHADQANAVIESNEDNNVSAVQIQITGDTITPLGIASGF